MHGERLRLHDANEDLNRAIDELRDPRPYNSKFDMLIPVVRVLGSIAVTLAMMLDHMRQQGGK